MPLCRRRSLDSSLPVRLPTTVQRLREHYENDSLRSALFFQRKPSASQENTPSRIACWEDTSRKARAIRTRATRKGSSLLSYREESPHQPIGFCLGRSLARDRGSTLF